MNRTAIDVTYDFRTDTPKGKDADSHSQTLKAFHSALWSKPLPAGGAFTLDTETPDAYLHHKSELGEFWLGSDSIVHTYDYWVRTAHIMADVSESERAEFKHIAYTIGGFVVFPNNRIVGVQTMNQRRGTSREIDDRFDLTLECIRRHYLSEASPLTETITAYADFFTLFQTFQGYVDFFLLQDLVTDDYTSIRWFLPFANFSKPVIPQTIDDYRSYRGNSVAFVKARNRRLLASTTESCDRTND